MKNKKIVVGVNCVNFKDPKATYRQKIAIEVLLENKPKHVEIIDFCYPNEKMEEFKRFKTIYLKRNSREEIGNNRPLPYIKEIFDNLANLDDEDYIFGYINSDILLSKKFFDNFQTEDAFVFSRREITDVGSATQFNRGNYKFVWGGDTHAGADGFFFRKEWWLENRCHFHDDFILGETEWDTAYRYLILHKTSNHVNKRELLHVYHDAKWNTTSVGAKNNIKLWEIVKS